MELLYFLEKIRVPVLNELMLAVTYLGDEIAFLAVALVFFWCVDKRFGYYILSVGFLGTITNQFMKLWFRIPRPWVLDENFTILEQAREGASGYSFPSGHTQSSVGLFGGIGYITKNKVVRIICIAIVILVPLSRMYIGVHTPLDVGVAALMAALFIFVLKPVIFSKDTKVFRIFLAVMMAVSIGYLCFVELYPFPDDIDTHNLESGLKNAYTLLGSIAGMIVAYFVEDKWVRFPTKAVWWAQILKIAIGLGLVLAVKSGLKPPLDAVFGMHIGRSVRYFVIVIVAGILWPLSFKWFSEIGCKE